MLGFLFAFRLFALFILVNTARALPAAEKELLIYNPRIISPKKGMTWRSGTTHEVTWETSDIPQYLRSSKGRILLGHDGNGSENLDMEHPLATGFPLAAGRITVTVPKTAKPRSDYFIVLFGDSGNTSQRFKIVKN